jgi:hypothetical protein
MIGSSPDYVFRMIPILGLKNNVPADDPSLFQFINENTAYTHDTGGINVDYQRQKNTCTKSYGYTAWSNTAVGTPTRCLGMFELSDYTTGNRDNIIIYDGDVYVYDGNKDPAEVTDTGSTAFASDEGDIYSMIRYGQYFIFADRAEHTPYKWKHGDANLTKLILSGTEFKFRYLAKFQQRILGAYSDQTNGDLDFRWTDAIPAWASLDFAAANQLYKPGEDSITGMCKFGTNNAFLYGTNSICVIQYYAGVTPPFGIFPLIEGQGNASPQGIINTGGANFFFNENLGFVRYTGGTQLRANNVISDDIEEDIAGIDSRYYDRIIGRDVPMTQEICWSVPLAGATTPTHLLYYNYVNNSWRKEDKASRYIDIWTQTVGQYGKLVFSNADGSTYKISGETLPSTSNIDGYRIEPIIMNPHYTTLNEIRWGIVDGGNYSIDVYYRGGDTVKEIEAASWTSVGTVSLNNPADPVTYVSQSNRGHQIKWGTNLDSEKFAVNWIDFHFIEGVRH